MQFHESKVQDLHLKTCLQVLSLPLTSFAVLTVTQPSKPVFPPLSREVVGLDSLSAVVLDSAVPCQDFCH